MINKLLYKYTSELPCRLIPRKGGEPYLERYYVGHLFGVTFYLHRFVSSDQEEHLHNHPWEWAKSLILSGSYDEEVVIDLCANLHNGCYTTTRTVRFWNDIGPNHFHRIANAKPGTWSLFFHGKRQRVKVGQCSVSKGWGFLTKSYLFGLHDTVCFVPHPSAESNWWNNARKGKNIRRQPL